MNAEAVQRALRAWAQAIRGDWGTIDGRTCRGQLQDLAAFLDADAEPVRWEDACRAAGVCWFAKCWPEHCPETTGYDCAHMQRDSFESRAAVVGDETETAG